MKNTLLSVLAFATMAVAGPLDFPTLAPEVKYIVLQASNPAAFLPGGAFPGIFPPALPNDGVKTGVRVFLQAADRATTDYRITVVYEKPDGTAAVSEPVYVVRTDGLTNSYTHADIYLSTREFNFRVIRVDVKRLAPVN